MMFYSDYVSDSQLIAATKNTEHLDTCYIVFYQKTWTGTPHRRANLEHLNSLIPRLAKNVRFLPIATFPDITERFQVETTCRNLVLQIAKQEKHKICFVQDSDEFMLKSDYEGILTKYIPEMLGGGFDAAGIRWINFWKNWDWVLTNERGEIAFEWDNFIIDLDSDVQFTLGRTIYGNKSLIYYPYFLYHGCYVLTNEEVRDKINTCNRLEYIGMDMEKWYEEKWLNWTPDTENLHPSATPSLWKRAIRYGKLPNECMEYCAS
jgi:hypothetical protein